METSLCRALVLWRCDREHIKSRCFLFHVLFSGGSLNPACKRLRRYKSILVYTCCSPKHLYQILTIFQKMKEEKRNRCSEILPIIYTLIWVIVVAVTLGTSHHRQQQYPANETHDEHQQPSTCRKTITVPFPCLRAAHQTICLGIGESRRTYEIHGSVSLASKPLSCPTSRRT